MNCESNFFNKQIAVRFTLQKFGPGRTGGVAGYFVFSQYLLMCNIG